MEEASWGTPHHALRHKRPPPWERGRRRGGPIVCIVCGDDVHSGGAGGTAYDAFASFFLAYSAIVAVTVFRMSSWNSMPCLAIVFISSFASVSPAPPTR